MLDAQYSMEVRTSEPTELHLSSIEHPVSSIEIQHRVSSIEYHFSKGTELTISSMMVTICNPEASSNP